MTAQHGYESIMQELTDNIENAEAEIARRSKVKAEREQEIADALRRQKQIEWEIKRERLSGAASACCVGVCSCVGLLVRNSDEGVCSNV